MKLTLGLPGLGHAPHHWEEAIRQQFVLARMGVTAEAAAESGPWFFDLRLPAGWTFDHARARKNVALCQKVSKGGEPPRRHLKSGPRMPCRKGLQTDLARAPRALRGVLWCCLASRG